MKIRLWNTKHLQKRRELMWSWSLCQDQGSRLTRTNVFESRVGLVLGFNRWRDGECAGLTEQKDHLVWAVLNDAISIRKLVINRQTKWRRIRASLVEIGGPEKSDICPCLSETATLFGSVGVLKEDFASVPPYLSDTRPRSFGLHEETWLWNRVLVVQDP
jgi:hypothetical protein